MRLWTSHYTLQARTTLNGIAKNQIRHGALLKIESQHGFGYSDVHPWPELGDPSLEIQLASLLNSQPAEIAERSLALAQLDAGARAKNQSVFYGLCPPPLSHYLTSAQELSVDFLQSLAADGFRTVKIKLGGNLDEEKYSLIKYSNELSQFKLRFDFNGQMSFDTYHAFLGHLPGELIRAIEFVEDPIDGRDYLHWNELKLNSPVPIAIDQMSSQDLEIRRSQWIMLKPAKQKTAPIFEWAKTHHARISVTSYLDHPVGQVGAALEASRIRTDVNTSTMLGTCGLNSHLRYHDTDYSRRLKSRGPEFVPPEGTGIGFDDLLSREQWVELK